MSSSSPSTAAAPPSTYTQGHHRSVTQNHASRTAEKEGSFVLPYLKPDFRILDIGCGPGSITCGFAKYVPLGSVVGIDLSASVISQASTHLASLDPAPSNVSFAVDDVLIGLDYPDSYFDVVFCNQTLLHIPDPVAALREMKRVCKKSTGLVACREADWPFRFHPFTEGIALWHKYLYLMAYGVPSSTPASSSTSKFMQWDPEHPENAPHPPGFRSGSMIHVYAREAGFDPDKVVKKGGLDVFASKEERAFHARNMMARLEEGGHREKYKKAGATDEMVDMMLRDWKVWADNPDGWFAIAQCEVVCLNS